MPQRSGKVKYTHVDEVQYGGSIMSDPPILALYLQLGKIIMDCLSLSVIRCASRTRWKLYEIEERRQRSPSVVSSSIELFRVLSSDGFSSHQDTEQVALLDAFLFNLYSSFPQTSTLRRAIIQPPFFFCLRVSRVLLITFGGSIDLDFDDSGSS